MQNKLPVALIKNQVRQLCRTHRSMLSRAAAAGISRATRPKTCASRSRTLQGRPAYPISSYTYILVYKEQKDATKGKALVDFLWWGIHDGENFAKELQYAPLPADIVKRAEVKINSITAGGKPLR